MNLKAVAIKWNGLKWVDDPDREVITEAVNDRPVCTRKGCGFHGSRALCPDCPDVKNG